MLRLLRRNRAVAYSFCLNNKVFGLASKIGGSSQQGLYQQFAGKFVNSDLLQYKQNMLKGDPNCTIPGVNVLTTAEECKQCADMLMRTDSVVAWDTQTMDLDIKQQAPVGHGKIICASFYAGPQYNFGHGPRVFIDNFGTNAGLIDYFKEYLESQQHKKVWHNYGFDRHLFYNHGINVRGFGADTMHMARLYDSGKMPGQYSLASLTKEYEKDISMVHKGYPNSAKKKLIQKLRTIAASTDEAAFMNEQLRNLDRYEQKYRSVFKIKKTKMEDIFRRRRVLKSGGQGVSYEYPNTITLHTNGQFIKQWIEYSVLDSEATFYLREVMKFWLIQDKLRKEDYGLVDMFDLYNKHWAPFGEVLTDMERHGIKMDMNHMKKIEEQAKSDMHRKQEQFKNFLYEFQRGRNIDHFNPSSSLQLQQLLHAPYTYTPVQKQEDKKKGKQEFDDEYERGLTTERDAYETKDDKKVVNRKDADLSERVKTFKVDNKFGTKPKKIEMEVMGLGLPAIKTTPLKLPSVDESVLEEMAGDPDKGRYGSAYNYFKEKGNEQFGIKLCHALQTLIEYRNIETLVNTFIEPLAGYIDETERIHCSLNINTETGRLSSRKPNLQNQPALDKDIYKIRQAFVAAKGNKLIVSDYGQLELRVLAHLTNCKAMIEAFQQGGDFHSRTAIGMYDYIKKDIEEGKVLLQWDKSKGPSPVPLVKQKYAAERKKAKTVNFSIAYGKTAQGFARDWDCSQAQAKKVIEAWFSDRKQVENWQRMKKDVAQKFKLTQTLLGRYRKLDRLFTDNPNLNKKYYGMRQRRAINTPVQGGAADIVIGSMIKIARNQRIKELGWHLVMQIHDELILEGPQATVEQAFELVKYDMEHPLDKDLRVSLEVDAKVGDSWYECK